MDLQCFLRQWVRIVFALYYSISVSTTGKPVKKGENNDRFAALREVFEEMNKKFGKALVPEDYISLDETLYPTRQAISFKQYNPDKPAKYGLLFKSLNSARYPYTYQSIVYAGKPESDPDERYYVTGTINYIKQLVENLGRYQNLQGRNISMDPPLHQF